MGCAPRARQAEKPIRIQPGAASPVSGQRRRRRGPLAEMPSRSEGGKRKCNDPPNPPVVGQGVGRWWQPHFALQVGLPIERNEEEQPGRGRPTSVAAKYLH